MTTKKAKPKRHVVVSKHKVEKMGWSQFKNATPVWAKYIVGIHHVVSVAFAAWMYATNLIPAGYKAEINLVLIAFNAIVIGMASLFGVETVTKRTTKTDAP